MLPLEGIDVGGETSVGAVVLVAVGRAGAAEAVGVNAIWVGMAVAVFITARVGAPVVDVNVGLATEVVPGWVSRLPMKVLRYCGIVLKLPAVLL